MVDVRGDVLRPPHGTTPAASLFIHSILFTKAIRGTLKIQYDTRVIVQTTHIRNIQHSNYIFHIALQHRKHFLHMPWEGKLQTLKNTFNKDTKFS